RGQSAGLQRPVLRARCSTAAAPVAGPAPSDRVGPRTVRPQWTVADVRLSDLISPFRRLWDRGPEREAVSTSQNDRTREKGVSRQAEIVAATGQFSWPSMGSSH